MTTMPLSSVSRIPPSFAAAFVSRSIFKLIGQADTAAGVLGAASGHGGGGAGAESGLGFQPPGYIHLDLGLRAARQGLLHADIDIARDVTARFHGGAVFLSGGARVGAA